jgi:regulator of PEP synthase PpsR (kinase-PPPase family)
MNAGRLAELRRARAAYLGLGGTGYASPDEIRKELLYSQSLCLDRSWRTIDVTGKSVEEVAREILDLGRYEGPAASPAD